MSCDGICYQCNVNGSIGERLEAGCRHQKVRTSKILMRKYSSTSELSTFHMLQWYSYVSCVWQSREAWEVTLLGMHCL